MAGPTPTFSETRPRILAGLRILMVLFSLIGSTVLQSCKIEVEAPPETGFIAVIMSAQGPAQSIPGQRYTLHIKELSGTLNINDVYRVLPNDTLVRTYPLASYLLTVDSVPSSCSSRYGNEQQALISEPGNTWIARFNYVCNSLLTIVVAADGNQVDSSFVWTVTAPDGTQRFGTADTADTIGIDNIPGGEYTVELGHISDNCILTSDGWRKQKVIVNPPLTTTAYFRVRCFNPARRPHITKFGSSFRNGVSGFFAEVVDTDPDDEIGAYAWNITDCLGSPLFPGVGVLQEALRFDRTKGQDTARIIVSVTLPPAALNVQNACTAVRFEDLEGNTTPWIEDRSGNETGRAPVITKFDVVFDGIQLRTTMQATDPDNDLAGAFVTITFRDGTQTVHPDGRPDIRAFNVAGYLPPFTTIPYIVVDNKFLMQDIISVNVDVLDRAGNMTRAVDSNFTQQ